MSNQEKYNAYLKWFSENVANQSNWGWMRTDRDCCNWRDENARPEPYAYGEALLIMSDPVAMQKALSTKIESNHRKYNDMSRYVNGDPKQGAVDPVYAERFRQGRELNKSLGKLSPEEAMAEMARLIASQGADGADYDEELFYARMKKKDAAVESTSQAAPDNDEPSSLAADFLHLLWKHGLPVQKFLPKSTTLSVDVANKITQKD